MVTQISKKIYTRVSILVNMFQRDISIGKMDKTKNIE